MAETKIPFKTTEALDSSKPLMLVLGPSGVQVTSLIKAGLHEHYNLVSSIAPFMQGSGYSPKDFSGVSNFVEFYYKLASQFKKPIIIYGHSSLGLLALLLAKRHPEVVSKVIAANTPISMCQTPKMAEQYFIENHSDGWRLKLFQKEKKKLSLPSLAIEKVTKNDKPLTKGDEFLGHYVAKSPRIWYDEKWAKNEGGVASEFWAKQPDQIIEGMPQHLFAVLIKEAQQVLAEIFQCNAPVLYTSGLHDGEVPPLEIRNIPGKDLTLPKSWTWHLFKAAAHWSTEDPAFKSIVTAWVNDTYDSRLTCNKYDEGCKTSVDWQNWAS